MAKFTGSCHCQAVQFEVSCSLDISYQCDCSLCARKGAKMVYAQPTDFALVKGEESLSCYQFNTHVAEHYFCKLCGIYTFHKTRMQPSRYGINTGCLEGINVGELEVKTINGSAR